MITLKLQSTFPTTDIFHETLLDWGRKVEAMAGGRLKLDILPSGAVVGAFQLIDAVNDGILDGGLGVPAYWFGKNKGVSLFGPVPASAWTLRCSSAGTTTVEARPSTRS